MMDVDRVHPVAPPRQRTTVVVAGEMFVAVPVPHDGWHIHSSEGLVDVISDDDLHQFSIDRSRRIPPLGPFVKRPLAVVVCAAIAATIERSS